MYSKPFIDERGATLIEIAIACAFILVPLAAAVIDLGSALRNTQVIVEAAKQGARAGAQSVIDVNARECCEKQEDGTCKPASALMSCAELLAASPTTVNSIGKKATCEYLRDAGFTPDAWQVTPEFTVTKDPPFVEAEETEKLLDPDTVGPDTETQILRISVKTPPDKKPCFICFGNLGRTSSAITFALDNHCSGPTS